MNKLQTTILITGFAILAISVLPVSSVFAVSNFTVNFEQEPLFNEANFLPGETVTRWIDVTNNSSEVKTIGIEATNHSSCSENCLSDKLKLEISDGSSNLYEAFLTDFFAAGEKKLSDLGTGSTTRYYFNITFFPGAENNYQNKEVNFDFDIGIFGQETIGGNGGNSGGSIGLIIFNENASPVEFNQIYIAWETNKLATSRVIYSAEGELHALQLDNPPNYGYVHSTIEDSSPVFVHSVNIAGLEPGVTYYYRCVSRGSFAVSTEHSFTVPGVKAAEIVSEEENAGGAISLLEGVGGGNEGGGNEGIIENNPSGGTAAGALPAVQAAGLLGVLRGLLERIWNSGFGKFILLLLLLILILLVIIWIYKKIRKKKES